MTTPQSKGRQQLVLLAAVFLGPLLIAFVLYYGEIGWQPDNTTENGELIVPPPLLPDWQIDPDPTAESPRFRGKWSLIMVGSGDCDPTCEKRLYETRQVRKALNRDRDRVQRVFQVTDGQLDAEFIRLEHPGLIILEPDSPLSNELTEAIGDYSAGDVFLADPIGNLIMRFPRDIGMNGMHTDLKQLLKFSRIG